MHAVCIVATVFGSLVLALAVICGTILFAIRLRHGGLSRKDRQHRSDEAGIIQETYHGISRMEERVEALETIILDR